MCDGYAMCIYSDYWSVAKEVVEVRGANQSIESLAAGVTPPSLPQ